MFNVLEISRMTTHNGPGYRTNVHFMGCPLSCRWCSTPESQKITGLGFNEGRCIGCGYCVSVCPSGALSIKPGEKVRLDRSKCTHCYRCTEECYAKALWQYGTGMDLISLYHEITKDRLFFKNSGGGITFSGGECLMIVDDSMVELYRMLHDDGFSIGVDTSGCVPWENIEKLLPYIDFFLWDIKHLDSNLHKKYTGVGNELILDNLRKIIDRSNANIYIRYPLIPEINDSDEDIAALCGYLKTLERIEELHYLPYHHLGKNRYRFCGMDYLMGDAERQSQEKLQHILSLTKDFAIPCRIVG